MASFKSMRNHADEKLVKENIKIDGWGGESSILIGFYSCPLFIVVIWLIASKLRLQN